MLQKATETNYFSYKREARQNPFIGIMSFQHFRDEALYSDVTVLPERNMTETEDCECYPIPSYVEQNGREEGYYPDTSIAYFRVLWKEFEPERGVYNYAFIEDILKKAKEHGQTLIFRLLPHSTRESDDIPDWLKDIIKEYPKRPPGVREKASPTDPRFLEYFGEAIRRIGERFDSDPTLDAIDICLPGAWGEGYMLELYSDEDLQRLYDCFTESFKETRLIGQVGRPELLHYVRERCKVGWRGDGLGEPNHSFVSYPAKIEKIKDLWQEAPVSFESYWWLGEWKRKSWDIDEIVSLTLKWHISSLNPKSFPIPNEWKDKIDYWVDHMGYHFAIDYLKYPKEVKSGDEIEFKLGIDNVGVAPLYHSSDLLIRLKNEKAEYVFNTDIDLTKWMPGKSLERFYINLPDDVFSGEYEVQAKIENENAGPICFCTDADCCDDWYTLAKVSVNG